MRYVLSLGTMLALAMVHHALLLVLSSLLAALLRKRASVAGRYLRNGCLSCDGARSAFGVGAYLLACLQYAAVVISRVWDMMTIEETACALQCLYLRRRDHRKERWSTQERLTLSLWSLFFAGRLSRRWGRFLLAVEAP